MSKQPTRAQVFYKRYKQLNGTPYFDSFAAFLPEEGALKLGDHTWMFIDRSAIVLIKQPEGRYTMEIHTITQAQEFLLTHGRVHDLRGEGDRTYRVSVLNPMVRASLRTEAEGPDTIYTFPDGSQIIEQETRTITLTEVE